MQNFKKYFIIPEEPAIVYAALTNVNTIKLWTGMNAEMRAIPNSEFSLWDEDIVGMNLAFEQDKLIQQEWYFGDQEEASIVTIKLHPHKRGTSLELLHTNIPDEVYEEMIDGWEFIYMADLIDFFKPN